MHASSQLHVIHISLAQSEQQQHTKRRVAECEEENPIKQNYATSSREDKKHRLSTPPVEHEQQQRWISEQPTRIRNQFISCSHLLHRFSRENVSRNAHRERQQLRRCGVRAVNNKHNLCFEPSRIGQRRCEAGGPTSTATFFAYMPKRIPLVLPMTSLCPTSRFDVFATHTAS